MIALQYLLITMDVRTMKPTCNFPYCKKSKLQPYNIFNESERLSCISEHFWKCTREKKKKYINIVLKMRKKSHRNLEISVAEISVLFIILNQILIVMLYAKQCF